MGRRLLLGGIALALVAVGGGTAVLRLRHKEAPAASGPLAITIAGERLTVPPDWIRFASQRSSGEAPRLDIGLGWPDLTPEPAAPAAVRMQAPAQAEPPGTPGTARTAVVFAVEPRPTELDMSARLGTVYARFLLPDALDAPDGLVGRKLAAGSGYEDEELYFEPGAVRPFVARCFPLERRGPVVTCLTDANIGRGLLLSLRFPRALLSDWRALGRALETVADRLLKT